MALPSLYPLSLPFAFSKSSDSSPTSRLASPFSLAAHGERTPPSYTFRAGPRAAKDAQCLLSSPICPPDDLRVPARHLSDSPNIHEILSAAFFASRSRVVRVRPISLSFYRTARLTLSSSRNHPSITLFRPQTRPGSVLFQQNTSVSIIFTPNAKPIFPFPSLTQFFDLPPNPAAFLSNLFLPVPGPHRVCPCPHLFCSNASKLNQAPFVRVISHSLLRSVCGPTRPAPPPRCWALSTLSSVPMRRSVHLSPNFLLFFLLFFSRDLFRGRW